MFPKQIQLKLKTLFAESIVQTFFTKLKNNYLKRQKANKQREKTTIY